MNKIIVASKNIHKMKEIKKILNVDGVEIISLKDLKFTAEIVENAETFIGNAIIKAETISNYYQLPCIADDSGLEITELNGFPGVYSARFLGENTDYEIKNAEILKRTQFCTSRKARYVCAIALAIPGKKTITVEEYFDGEIAHKPSGKNGFGYDPIFFLPTYQKTAAEISEELKNKISHRAKALEKLRQLILEKGMICE